MNPSRDDLFPRPDDPLDALVRAQLEAVAGTVDSAPLLEAVCVRLDPPQPVLPVLPRRTTWKQRLRVLMPVVLAASLLLGLFLVQPGSEAQAAAAQVVAQARDVHAAAVDRCYLLESELAPELRQRFPTLRSGSRARLWTRGDRFWVQSIGADRACWGRDEKDRVWMAPTPNAGMRFDADEMVPRSLHELLQVRSVQLPTLLDEVLRECVLTDLKPGLGTPPGVRIIEAHPTHEQSSPHLTSARIEVDATTHVVRKLVLHRRLLGNELGTVTLTLVETRPQKEDAYRLEGHLRPGAPIYDRTMLFLRARMWPRFWAHL